VVAETGCTSLGSRATSVTVTTSIGATGLSDVIFARTTPGVRQRRTATGSSIRVTRPVSCCRVGWARLRLCCAVTAAVTCADGALLGFQRSWVVEDLVVWACSDGEMRAIRTAMVAAPPQRPARRGVAGWRSVDVSANVVLGTVVGRFLSNRDVMWMTLSDTCRRDLDEPRLRA
jgi:hypothetical protein